MSQILELTEQALRSLCKHFTTAQTENTKSYNPSQRWALATTIADKRVFTKRIVELATWKGSRLSRQRLMQLPNTLTSTCPFQMKNTNITEGYEENDVVNLIACYTSLT